MLKKFKMEDSKPVGTPMVTGCKLSNNDEYMEVYHTVFISMIGSLLYVTATRPDVMQAVGLVARFQSATKETHVTAVKRILIYLQRTMEYGLSYPKGKEFTFKAFTDADWEGSVDDWKSTSGEAFFMGNCLVSWTSKKNPPFHSL